MHVGFSGRRHSLAQSEAQVWRPSLLWALVLLRILAVELPFSSYVTRLFQALIQQNTQEFLMCRSTSGNKHEFSTELEQRGACRVHARPLAFLMLSLSLCSCKQIELAAPPRDIVPTCLRFIVRKGGVSFFTLSRLKTLLSMTNDGVLKLHLAPCRSVLFAVLAERSSLMFMIRRTLLCRMFSCLPSHVSFHKNPCETSSAQLRSHLKTDVACFLPQKSYCGSSRALWLGFYNLVVTLQRNAWYEFVN